jgi:hypothetical protein
MRSHLKWTWFSVIGALALLATSLAVGAGTGQNLVINGDFENGNTGFTTGYRLGDVSGPEPLGIGVIAATIRRELER